MTATVDKATVSPAQRRAAVREMARQLDFHDAEHTGAWGEPEAEPDVDCIWCQ